MNIRLKKEQKIKITNSEAIFEIMKKVLLRENTIGRKKEHFWVIGLATNRKLQYLELVSLGSVSVAIVNPMEVFSFAVQKKTPNIILVHNHPSDELEPSNNDMEITEKIIEGGKLLNITVLDHIIITPNKYYSFCDEVVLHK